MPFETGVQAILKNINYWLEALMQAPDKITDATEEWFIFLG
jgi:hypothetical protein